MTIVLDIFQELNKQEKKQNTTKINSLPKKQTKNISQNKKKNFLRMWQQKDLVSLKQ